MFRSASTDVMYGGLGCVRLFSSSSKCSFHLLLCSSSPSSYFDVLSLTGLFCLARFPANFLVMSYRSFMFSVFAACSACVASSSMYFLLSALILCFVIFLAFSYSFCAFVFSALVLLDLTFALLILSLYYFLKCVVCGPFFVMVLFHSKYFVDACGEGLLYTLPTIFHCCLFINFLQSLVFVFHCYIIFPSIRGSLRSLPGVISEYLRASFRFSSV